VTLVHDDAMVWLDEEGPSLGADFDVVIVDFPDPNNFSLGKLYTTRFYRLVQDVMHDGSALGVQTTSPLYARRSFWCIERTLAASGLHTAPYHATVPSFGEWGYVLARKQPFERPASLAIDGLRYLDDATLRTLFVFGRDMAPVEVEPNRLDDQRLVHYYEREWSRWN
jgi:spermidine synthase